MTEFFVMKFLAFDLENLTKILVLVAIWFCAFLESHLWTLYGDHAFYGPAAVDRQAVGEGLSSFHLL